MSGAMKTVVALVEISENNCPVILSLALGVTGCRVESKPVTHLFLLAWVLGFNVASEALVGLSLERDKVHVQAGGGKSRGRV